jgi:hypothetical protein
MLIVLIVLIAAGVGLGVYFGVIDADDIADWRDKTNDFFEGLLETDPFSGLNGTVYVWQGASGQGGLDLELLNALTDDYQSFFSQAVSDWDSGTPDALTLTTSKISAESECSQVTGKMKVCNGDYGETGWRGINNFLTEQDRIISSAAKMNEFYLTTEGDDFKTYTMCHGTLFCFWLLA